MPAYRGPDIDDILAAPDVDWDAVKDVLAGRRSPLLAHITKPKNRSMAIRRACLDAEHRFGVPVWAIYLPRVQKWRINWALDGGLQPTYEQMSKVVADHPDAARYADDVTLLSRRWSTIHWAQRMLQPGQAVIVDTETTDLPGLIVEIAVIDAATGETLLDTLVNPGTPISDGATGVHGLADTDVADAPTWAQVLPQLLAAIDGRTILAYNGAFDREVIADHTRHVGADPAQLPATDRWGCLMVARSAWLGYREWLPLDGGHRALGDCLAARKVLQQIAATTPPAAAAR